MRKILKKVFVSVFLLALLFSFNGAGRINNVATPIYILNRSHPLAQGLVQLYRIKEGGGTIHFDLVQNLPATSTGTNSVKGVLINSIGTSMDLNTRYSAGRNLTVVVVFTPTGTPTVGSHSLYINANSTVGALYVRMQTDGTIHFLKGQTTDIGNGSLSGYTVGKKYFIAFTIDNLSTANYNIYEGNKNIKSATTALTFSTGTPRIGNEGNSGAWDCANGYFELCYVYKRPLLLTEITQLFTNPDQIFIQKQPGL